MGFGYTKDDAKTLLRAQYVMILTLIFWGSSTFCIEVTTGESTHFSLAISLSLLFCTVGLATMVILNKALIISRVQCKVILLWSKGKFEKAEKLIDKKIDKDFFGLRHLWMNIKAMMMIKKKRLDEAEKMLNKLEITYPISWRVPYHKACLESVKGNSKESLRYLIKSLQKLEEFKKTKKNPIYKFWSKRWRPRLISYAIKDEDLSKLRESKEFWRFVNYFDQTGEIYTCETKQKRPPYEIRRS
ncbi:MAG: hypothetical protein R6U17_01945 [Thermoplasmata archaeon]